MKKTNFIITTIKEYFRTEKPALKPCFPNNFMEALEFNGFSISEENDKNATTIFFDNLLEDAQIIKDFDKKGGTIVFSVDINAESLSKNKIINYFKQKIETFKNIANKDKKINKVISRYGEVQGISIGNFFKGRYKAKDGTTYDEKSMSITIYGVDSDTLNNIASDLAIEFNQESALVENYENNRIYLIGK